MTNECCAQHDVGRATVEYRIVGVPDVPVVWFDTHAVSELAEAVASDRADQQRPLLRELHRRVVELRQANRIVVLETDQMYEVEHVPRIARRCSEMLTQLSQGARSSCTTVQQRQFEIGMRTHLARQAQRDIDWSTCWEDDPFADHSVHAFGAQVFVRVRVEPSTEQLALRRATADKIAAQWEQRRAAQQGIRRPRAQRLQEQIAVERTGQLQVVRKLVEDAYARIDSGEPFTGEELDIQNGLVSAPLRIWRTLGGVDLADMIDYYASPHHQELPFVDIASRLAAGRITGNETIKPSDWTDIKNIAAFLPYCTHMVLDKAMIEAVKASGLSDSYGTRVLRLRQLGEVLDAVD